MSCATEWLIYVVENPVPGRTEWYFWNAELRDWVSDLERATRYAAEGDAEIVAAALSIVAAALSNEREIGARVIDWRSVV